MTKKIYFEPQKSVLGRFILHCFYDLKFLDNETTALWIFVEICSEEPFPS